MRTNNLRSIRTPSAICFDIERTRQALEADVRDSNYASYWNRLTLLSVYYGELYELVGEVLDMPLPKLQTEQDQMLVFTDSEQDGVLMSQQAYHELLSVMSPLDRATHVCVPVAPEVASEVDSELNTLKRGFNKINGLAKKSS